MILEVAGETDEVDVTSLAEGYITVTPLHFDLTRHDLLPALERWDWSPEERGEGPGTRGAG